MTGTEGESSVDYLLLHHSCIVQSLQQSRVASFELSAVVLSKEQSVISAKAVMTYRTYDNKHL